MLVYSIKMSEICTGWCAPTVIYTILSLISLILGFTTLTMQSSKSNQTSPSSTSSSSPQITLTWQQYIISLITTLLFGALLYVLCKKCHKGLAWVLLLLPLILSIIFIIFIVLLLVSIGNSINNKNK